MSDQQGSPPSNKRGLKVALWTAAGVVGVLAVAGSGLIVADASSKETRSQSFSVTARPSLVIDNETNGRIDVRTGASDTVQVDGDLRGAWRLSYSARQDGNTIIVSAKSKGPFEHIGGSQSARVTVTVPEGTTIDLRASNGRIDVAGVGAGGRLRTDNGSIKLTGVRGPFDAETDNGSISFEGEATQGSDYRLKTDNGGVKVKLLGNTGVHIDAATDNGRVKSKLPVLATVTGNHRLVGDIGDGSASLHIRTDNGGVTIE